MNLCIYQIDKDCADIRLKFCSLSETRKYSGGVHPEMYSKVFDGEVACQNNEEVFLQFNTDPPVTHIGHSLSVSDVIEADGEFFFCDRVGFEKIDFDSSKVQQKDTLRVLIVEPHNQPYIANIPNGYQSFQRIVGGTFECIALDDDTVIYCNDEAKLIGLDGNRKIGADIIAGTFVIAGDNHCGDTISLTDEQMKQYTKRFQEPEEYTTEEVEETCFMRFISF